MRHITERYFRQLIRDGRIEVISEPTSSSGYTHIRWTRTGIRETITVVSTSKQS